MNCRNLFINKECMDAMIESIDWYTNDKDMVNAVRRLKAYGWMYSF